jgi:hypothetical protein
MPCDTIGGIKLIRAKFSLLKIFTSVRSTYSRCIYAAV